MDIVDYVIDFFLKYIVCPWEEISSYTIAIMIASIGLVILAFITISLNRVNDFKEECKKLRAFIYVVCIFLIPCFSILLPIYLFIPALIFSLLEIKKKEKAEIKKLYDEYGLTDLFDQIYISEKADIKKELIFTILSSILILGIMDFIGFGYSIKPILPNI